MCIKGSNFDNQLTNIMTKTAYNLQQEFFKDYSSQKPFTNIIYKIRRFENTFYRDLKDLSKLSSSSISLLNKQKILQRTLREYSVLLLKLRLKALMKVHTEFGHEMYQIVAKDFGFICNLTENVMTTKVKELNRNFSFKKGFLVITRNDDVELLNQEA